MPYCTNCGNPINQNANFCGNCGTMNTTTQSVATYTPQSSSPLLQSTPIQEHILSFIIMSKDKRFGTDYYTAVLTSQQMIFVPMTKDMLKQVTEINRQEAKGKFAPVQIYPYQQSYFSVPPIALITPDYLVIQNGAIQQIKIRRVSVPGDEYGYLQEYEVQLTSTMGTHVFKMSTREENVTKLMQAYSGRVVLR
jgi:hypothetical protein